MWLNVGGSSGSVVHSVVDPSFDMQTPTTFISIWNVAPLRAPRTTLPGTFHEQPPNHHADSLSNACHLAAAMRQFAVEVRYASLASHLRARCLHPLRDYKCGSPEGAIHPIRLAPSAMRSFVLTAATVLATLPLLAHAAVGSACSVSGTPGVCLATATCTSGSGTTHTGFCPNDPADVKCCTKSCSTGGHCQPVSSCASGNTLSGMMYKLL